MAATLLGKNGATRGMSDEAGVIIENLSFQATAEKEEIVGPSTDYELISYHARKQSISGDGIVLGTTGVMAGAPGVALTLANSVNIGGITTGDIFVDDIQGQRSTGLYRMNFNASRYPGITNGS